MRPTEEASSTPGRLCWPGPWCQTEDKALLSLILLLTGPEQ